MGPAPKNLINMRFGKILVVSLLHGGSKRAYNCICDCGHNEVCLQLKLTTGRKFQCMSCSKKGKPAHNRTHGMRGTPEWNSWVAMRRRCNDPNNPSYFKYGARGISICPQWVTFENFLADMGKRPSGKSLGRINNDGNYEPSNCRWENPKQQANNRRKAPPRPSHPNSLKNLTWNHTKGQL